MNTLKLLVVSAALAVAVFAQAQAPVYSPAATPEPARQVVTAPGYGMPAASQLVCGHCGELLQAPAVVYVARPVNPAASAPGVMPAAAPAMNQIPVPQVQAGYPQAPQIAYVVNQAGYLVPVSVPVPPPQAGYYGAPPAGYYGAPYGAPYCYENRIPVPPRSVLLSHAPLYPRCW
jgi:hypothetical protein